MAKKTARYKTAQGYYEGAYRLRIKAIGRGWTQGQITSTVGWMWKHVATEAERNACTSLLKDKSAESTIVADDAKIPVEVKTAKDAAPVPVAATPSGPPRRAPGTDVIEGPAEGAARTDPPPTEGASERQKIPKVNTTRFHYMPADLHANHSDLPELAQVKLDNVKKRAFLAAGLADPDREQAGKRWRGTHFLGTGATGNCSHWVLTDENDNVEEKLAVRDTATRYPHSWIDPTNWRDRLPREIAVMRRLRDQGGDDNNIHRYFGHRIDMWKRRYRVYTEVCDLGNIEGALDHYSRLWRQRRHLHKWQIYLERHPDIVKSHRDSKGMSPGATEAAIEDTKRSILRKIQKAKEENLSPRPGKEFEDMSDIEDWHVDEMSDELPEVIPEAFIWHVFDQLVDAALIMHRGGNPYVGEDKWEEIVHKDMHTGNIFVKPKDAGFFGNDTEKDSRRPKQRTFATFQKSEYPSVVLADFDTAFFDLQQVKEQYQDNPLHYVMQRDDKDAERHGGRYPPESFWQYQNRTDGPDGDNLTRFTSATDVWGIGSIMWNLVMNLPYYADYVAPFFDDRESHSGITEFRRLNNGQPYDKRNLQHLLLTGDRPFEASSQYSKQLKDTIRGCLGYHQNDRTHIEKLKKKTAKFRKRYMEEPGKADLKVRVDGRLQNFQVGKLYSPFSEESDAEDPTILE